MKPGRIPGGKLHILFCAILLLLSSPIGSASLLHWRQDDASSPATTDSAAATGSGTSTHTAATPATTTGTDTAAATSETAATASSNSTEVTESTSTAAAASSTHSSTSLNDTNDPSKCHVEHKGEGLGNPFCTPIEDQVLLVDERFPVTWDPSLYSSNTTNNITFTYLTDNGPKSDDIDTLQSTSVPNYQGTTYFNLSSSLLNGSSTLNLFLTLSNADHPHGVDGPTLLLSKTNTTHHSSSKDPDHIGKVVGIPVGLVFLIALVAVAVAYICIRKRRRGLGYGAGGQAARKHRLGVVPAGDHAGASRGTHRRDASFHDEPTRGMELQNRSGLAGGGATRDSWDWGSPVSSPTTAGARNSNAFREELQRQRSGRKF